MCATLVFDLDDTLYNLMDSFAGAHEELYADRTNIKSGELFAASRKYNAIAFDMWNRGEITQKEEFAYRIRESYREFGVELTEAEIEEFEKNYRQRQAHLQLSAEMTEILTVLTDHNIPMVLLTNGNHKDQWSKIQSLGLTRFIPEQHIFISEDLPAPKPDPAAFRTVEDILDLNPECTWYIGDTFEVDIIGAQRAGWHTIWFNHRRKGKTDPDVCPDEQAVSLAELKEIMFRIGHL